MSSPIWSSKTPFTLKKQEIVSIGRTSVSLYPKIDGSWPDAEKAMAYQQIKAALATAEFGAEGEGSRIRVTVQLSSLAADMAAVVLAWLSGRSRGAGPTKPGPAATHPIRAGAGATRGGSGSFGGGAEVG